MLEALPPIWARRQTVVPPIEEFLSETGHSLSRSEQLLAGWPERPMSTPPGARTIAMHTPSMTLVVAASFGSGL